MRSLMNHLLYIICSICSSNCLYGGIIEVPPDNGTPIQWPQLGLKKQLNPPRIDDVWFGTGKPYSKNKFHNMNRKLKDCMDEVLADLKGSSFLDKEIKFTKWAASTLGTKQTPIYLYASPDGISGSGNAAQSTAWIIQPNKSKIAFLHCDLDRFAAETGWTNNSVPTGAQISDFQSYLKSTLAHEMGHHYIFAHYANLVNAKYTEIFAVHEGFATYVKFLYFQARDKSLDLVRFIRNGKKYQVSDMYMYCMLLCLDFSDTIPKFDMSRLSEVDSYHSPGNITPHSTGNITPDISFLQLYTNSQMSNKIVTSNLRQKSITEATLRKDIINDVIKHLQNNTCFVLKDLQN